MLGGPREPGPKVLMVSDNSITLNFFHIYFEEERYNLVLCDAANKGFDACFRELDAQRPELVVIDVDNIKNKEEALSLANNIRKNNPLTALIIMFKDKDVEIETIQCMPDLLFFGHPELNVLNIQIGHALADRSRKLEEQRARARELQEMEREKRKFMQTAHDLKSEMTGLIGSMQLVTMALGGFESLNGAKLLSAIKEAQQDMEAATRSAEKIIEKVVKALRSRGNDGEDELFSPNDVIQEALNTVKKDALAKRVRLESTLDDSLEFMYGPQRIFLSAIYNLLLNAVQATPQRGEVSVSSKKTEDALELSVKDTGAGILAENLSRIWEPDFTSKEREGGTGVGMSIIKECSDLMGGKIKVVSKVNRGTTFTLTLPFYKRRSAG